MANCPTNIVTSEMCFGRKQPQGPSRALWQLSLQLGRQSFLKPTNKIIENIFVKNISDMISPIQLIQRTTLTEWFSASFVIFF